MYASYMKIYEHYPLIGPTGIKGSIFYWPWKKRSDEMRIGIHYQKEREEKKKGTSKEKGGGHWVQDKRTRSSCS